MKPVTFVAGYFLAQIKTLLLDPVLLKPEIQQFINSHIGDNITVLALSKNPFPEADWKEILNQVAAKAKAREKLPTWFAAEGIIYPAKISVEQASSEITAAYKATLVSGESLIDLTGGFGVDDLYFSKKTKAVAHCEINPELSAIVSHNFEQLDVSNIKCHTGDSLDILKKSPRKWTWIYIDPSRRHDAKGKVFLLKDCLPDVPGLLNLYFSFSDKILIKTSPLLDISAGLSELRNVKSIHVVAIKNEVKELLWELEKDFSGTISIRTVDIVKEREEIFDFELGISATASLGFPQKYLFEPNAAIMKSGAFEEIGVYFNLEKLHRHSHLYTSGQNNPDFPGRVFEIVKALPYTKTGMKELAKIGKANITTRNFPDSVESIRKKWKIGDGGNTFCFFTTDKIDNKIVLICSKIK